MSTVSKQIADKIIAGEFQKDDVVCIIKYNNIFNFEEAYKLITKNKASQIQWILDGKEPALLILLSTGEKKMHTNKVQLALIEEVFLTSKVLHSDSEWVTLEVPTDLYFAAIHAREELEDEPKRDTSAETLNTFKPEQLSQIRDKCREDAYERTDTLYRENSTDIEDSEFLLAWSYSVSHPYLETSYRRDFIRFLTSPYTIGTFPKCNMQKFIQAYNSSPLNPKTFIEAHLLFILLGDIELNVPVKYEEELLKKISGLTKNPEPVRIIPSNERSL